MISILKEEKDYIVINKPAGLVVHSDGKTEENTVCDEMVKKYPEIQGVGEPMKLSSGEVIDRPGIVHRLDRETSGVMVIARTQEGFEYFKSLFQDKKIEKTYHAFVYGNIKEDEGIVDTPIGRSKKNFKQWFAGLGARGKMREAITTFKVLDRSDNKEITFVSASPKTGRTHQIRVHFKSIYHPLVGDTLYSPDRENPLHITRTALHSHRIKFIDPEGNKVEVEAPYPVDFESALNTFKNLA